MCKPSMKRTKISTKKSLGFASVFPCKSLKPTLSFTLYWKLTILKIFSFVLITKSEIKIQITVKFNFELGIHQQLILIYIYRELKYIKFSLMLLVLSKTVQDEFSFTAKKSLITAPILSLLHWKLIILQTFSFPVISALKMKIKLHWNKILNWWFFNN